MTTTEPTATVETPTGERAQEVGRAGEDHQPADEDGHGHARSERPADRGQAGEDQGNPDDHHPRPGPALWSRLFAQRVQ